MERLRRTVDYGMLKQIYEKGGISMTYTFQPKGVCSQAMQVEVDDEGVIQKLEVVGGCSGNLQGISALVQGMPAKEAVRRLKGIHCGHKDTSCPDQLARNLERALEQQ